MGKIIHYEDISKEAMQDAVAFVLQPEIQENAKKISFSFRNRIKSPQETAVWWVEYVAATKGAPLIKSPSIHMSIFTYYSFDVYVSLTVIVMLTIGFWIWLFKMFRNKKKKLLKTKLK